jgi:hypothetical protein
MQRVDVLDQVDIDHPVVVEAQAFTDGILQFSRVQNVVQTL